MPGFIGTLVVLLIVCILVGLALRSVIKAKKSGKGSCSCGCSSCPKSCAPSGGSCIHMSDQEIREKMKK